MDMETVVRPIAPLHPVTSSACVAIGYDSDTKRLAVELKGGRVYYYAGVPEDVAAALIVAESKGRAYNDLRRKYTGARVTGPCEKCAAEGLIGHRCEDCGCGVHHPAERKTKGEAC